MKTLKYGSYYVTRSYGTTSTVDTENFIPHKVMLARVDGKGLRAEIADDLVVQKFETGIESCKGSKVKLEVFVFGFIKELQK